MKIFIYLITCVLSSHIFSASAEVYPDKWCINSAGLSISWGAAGNDKYISVVDCRTPHNSLLILPDGVTERSKAAFIKIHQEVMKELDTYSIEEIETGVKTLSDVSLSKLTPVEDDRALPEMMASNSGLIWTGAGISSISSIPTLLELYKKLGLKQGLRTKIKQAT